MQTRRANDRTTCVEVARMAGVGVSTVSRVINNPAIVSDKLRIRVERAIEATNYQPSAAARAMVSNRSNTVGVISESEQERTFYFANFIQGLSLTLTETGYHLALAMVHEGMNAGQLTGVPMLQTQSVDGLIIDLHLITGNLDSVLPTLHPPWVLVNPSMLRAYNTVKPDDPAAAQMAVDYLVSRGHRRIGYLPSGDPNPHSSHADRQNSYLHAMSGAGLPATLIDPKLPQHFDHAGLHDRLRRLVETDQCTALLVYDGINAAKVLRACYELDWRVPERVSLMACDDAPVLRQSVVPVSCVRIDRSEIGRVAFEMVLERINNEGRDLLTRIVEGVLQERESVRTATAH